MTIEQRQHVHGLWAVVADRWAEYADYVETRATGLNKALIDGAAIGRDDRVLELASGPGGLGLEAAGLAGTVVISDVVPRMVEVAAARAAALGLTNVTTKVLDLEEIDEPDGSFDAVVVREGLMFAVDPLAALAEIRRVLRRGGRLAASVWGPRQANPWLGLVMDAASAQLGREIPPPGMPGPFALSDADQLGALVRAAGFTEVVLDETAAPLHASSFDEWWRRTTALAGPLAGILAMLPVEAKAELEARVRVSAAPYVNADGIDFPGLAHVVSTRA